MSAQSPNAGETWRVLGLGSALAALALDQAHKFWMIHVFDIASRAPVEVTPFLDLVMVWNRGVSYGLFQQDGAGGRLALIGVAVAAAVGFGMWMWRTPSRLVALSLGLIIGGAVGNAIDRGLYGAVADFFLLSYGNFHWYVFNLADVWIVAGVIGLVYDSFIEWLRDRHGTAANDR